jgi:hypothetical protein
VHFLADTGSSAPEPHLIGSILTPVNEVITDAVTVANAGISLLDGVLGSIG